MIWETERESEPLLKLHEHFINLRLTYSLKLPTALSCHLINIHKATRTNLSRLWNTSLANASLLRIHIPIIDLGEGVIQKYA